MLPNVSRLAVDDTNHQVPPPPPTRVTGKSSDLLFSRRVGPRDITKEFNEASKALHQGQLVKDESFTLFESVGALEIMDPKMDSGVTLPDQDAIMDEFDPLKSLPPEEVLGIMDQLLCYEMTWHEGYPLSQTLFTSLHLDRLLPIERQPLHQIRFDKRNSPNGDDILITKVLRAYCLGLAKCCQSVIENIAKERYHEEEDFVSQTFDKYLLSDVDEDSIEAELKNAIDALSKLGLANNIVDAFRTRLWLRLFLVQAFQPDDPAESHTIKMEIWAKAHSFLYVLNDRDISYGIPVPLAFSERVQRYLASNTPPRPMIQTSWTEIYPKWRQMCEDNMEAYRLVASLYYQDSLGISPHSLMRFVWNFTSRKPQPSTYSRAILQSLLFRHNAVLQLVPHQDLLHTDLKEITLAGDPMLDHKQAQRKLDEFYAKASEEYMHIYRMICQNRCRIRRAFAQSIVIIDGLQAEAEIIDADIHNISKSATYKFAGSEPLQFYPLAAWVYFHKLRMMEWVVQLGFELEVYLPDELAGVYAFLDHLANTRSEHLQHIDFFLNLRQQRLSRSDQNELLIECKESRTLNKILVSQANATASLATALSRIFSALNTLRLVPVPPRSYSTPQLRHELRMKPFLPVGTPRIPTYEGLDCEVRMPSDDTTFESIFSDAEGALKDAKRHLQILKGAKPEEGKFAGCEEGWKKEVQGLLLSTIAAGVAVAGLRKTCEATGVNKVQDVEAKMGELKQSVSVQISEPDKRYHGWWVVPKVVEMSK